MRALTAVVRACRLLAWAWLVVLVPACSGSRSSPISPTVVQPAATFLIVGPGVVPTGASATYRITGRRADGTQITDLPAVTWTVDNVLVATIVDDGRLIAQGPGTAILTATAEGTSAQKLVRVAVHQENPGRANLAFSSDPDPVPGSLKPCGGAYWGNQTPTWSNVETLKETQGVGFTLKALTYSFYNQDGVLTSTITFQDDHYFPPYDVHVEDGCMALNGAKSGSFEEILEGVDDKGNQLTFISRLRLLPEP